MVALIKYFHDIKQANCYKDFQFEVHLGDKVLKIGNIDELLEFSNSKEFDDFDISKVCINYERHVVELTISYFNNDKKVKEDKE